MRTSDVVTATWPADQTTALTSVIGGSAAEVPHPLPVRIITACVLVLIMIFGLGGNVLVILSVKRNRKLHNNSNIFVVNLSIVALLTNTITLPPYVLNAVTGQLAFPSVLCKVLGYFNYALTMVLLANSITIAVYRCTLLSRPISSSVSFNSNKRIYCVVAVMWIAPMFVALLGVDFFGFHKEEMHCAFKVRREHYWYIFCFLAIPTAIALVSILLCYIFIVVRVRASKRKVQDHHNLVSGIKCVTRCAPVTNAATLPGGAKTSQQRPLDKSERYNRELKLTLRLVILFTVFCLLWIPLMLSYFLFRFVHIPSCLWLVSSVLARSYTSVNWLLYAFFNKQFCTSYLNILRCRKENQIIPILIQR